MKNTKLLLTLLTLFLFTGIGFSQSAKVQQKAADKVEEMNTMIVSINPDAALSVEQKEKIEALNVEKMMGVRKIKKSEATEEEKEVKRKALIKEISQKINKEILTKEQRQAKKEARAALSND